MGLVCGIRPVGVAAKEADEEVVRDRRKHLEMCI